MQRRARNPYINYHMMRFWPSLEMVLLTGFHSNLNLFASFGEDSAENWTRFENWWTIVNCYAECSPQQRQQLLHLPPLPEQNICMDQISRKQLVIFSWGFGDSTQQQHFKRLACCFSGCSSHPKANSPSVSCSPKKTKCVQKTTPMVQLEISKFLTLMAV